MSRCGMWVWKFFFHILHILCMPFLLEQILSKAACSYFCFNEFTVHITRNVWFCNNKIVFNFSHYDWISPISHYPSKFAFSNTLINNKHRVFYVYNVWFDRWSLAQHRQLLSDQHSHLTASLRFRRDFPAKRWGLPIKAQSGGRCCQAVVSMDAERWRESVKKTGCGEAVGFCRFA